MRQEGELRRVGSACTRRKLRLAVKAVFGEYKHGVELGRVFPHQARVVDWG